MLCDSGRCHDILIMAVARCHNTALYQNTSKKAYSDKDGVPLYIIRVKEHKTGIMGSARVVLTPDDVQKVNLYLNQM